VPYLYVEYGHCMFTLDASWCHMCHTCKFKTLFAYIYWNADHFHVSHLFYSKLLIVEYHFTELIVLKLVVCKYSSTLLWIVILAPVAAFVAIRHTLFWSVLNGFMFLSSVLSIVDFYFGELIVLKLVVCKCSMTSVE
jgi:hypothetical protein